MRRITARRSRCPTSASMPDPAAEVLLQVIAGRAEQAAIIVTTNLPFSE